MRKIFFSGTLVSADGSARTLGAEDFSLQPREYRDSRFGEVPVVWQLQADTGDEQLVGGGSPFNPEANLTDAVLDAEQRILYVTDSASLIAVDIDSGDGVLVSGFAF